MKATILITDDNTTTFKVDKGEGLLVALEIREESGAFDGTLTKEQKAEYLQRMFDGAVVEIKKQKMAEEAKPKPKPKKKKKKSVKNGKG